MELKEFEVGLGQMFEDGSPVVIAVDENNNPRLLGKEKVYLKSEADKVIAELKNQRDGAFGLTNSGLTLEDLNQIARKEIDRQKYKRCLAMAEMCNARYDEEDAKVNGSGASWEYMSKEMKYWERWRWRWDALAEKFKEAK